MTTTMQDRMLQAIRDKGSTPAGAEPLDVSDSFRWANTGHVLFQRNWDTVLDVTFDFQTTYASISLSGPGVDRLHLADNPPTWRLEDGGRITFHVLDYTDGARIRGMFDLIGLALAPVKAKAVK